MRLSHAILKSLADILPRARLGLIRLGRCLRELIFHAHECRFMILLSGCFSELSLDNQLQKTLRIAIEDAVTETGLREYILGLHGRGSVTLGQAKGPGPFCLVGQ